MKKQAYSAYENSNKDKPPPQYSSPILRISEEIVEKEISFSDKEFQGCNMLQMWTKKTPSVWM